MKALGPRFSAPISVARPRAARLLEGYSPKLGRRVQLFDHAAFAVWIGLEAAPAVISLCERPARAGPAATDRMIDFWVRVTDGEAFLVVTHDDAADELPARVDGIEVRHVGAADRAAANVWITNWQRMLPVINATRSVISTALMTTVRRFVREPTPLARIVHEFAVGDPTLVRGTVFEMLRTAQLAAPSLHTQPLSLHTVVEPTP